MTLIYKTIANTTTIGKIEAAGILAKPRFGVFGASVVHLGSVWLFAHEYTSEPYVSLP